MLNKKLFFFIIIIFLFCLEPFCKNQLENRIIRYIKFKKNKNLLYYDFEKELPKIKNYTKLLKTKFFKIKKYHKKIKKPKISFIASVYNKEKYLRQFISSIQNQYLEEYELIFVDDCSSDKSIEIINKYKKKDERIKLIQNKRNMGSLHTRYKGILYSKGKYVIFVDSDDIVLQKGVIKAYNHITKNNLDMIEFHSVYEWNETVSFINRRYYQYSYIIYQPILSYVFYYENKSGLELNTALWDKLIKREIALKSFNYIGEKYLKERIIIENDVIILFALFRNANSFQYINELGYYYFFNNNDSITNTKYEVTKSNDILHSIFCNIKFLFEVTEDSYLDKYFSIYKLEQGYERYKIHFKYMNTEYNLIKDILNKFLNSKCISIKKKIIINKIKNEIFMNPNFNKKSIISKKFNIYNKNLVL